MTETERERFREVAGYLFFGVLTTIVNYVGYYALTRWLGMGVTAATAWAWGLAVLFAFVTNKLWVFRSRTRGLAALGRELSAFVAARLFSGLLDVGMMWLFAEKLGWPDMWVKIGDNVFVTALNYVFSKRWIFRERV